jgi:hypothetical protein
MADAPDSTAGEDATGDDRSTTTLTLPEAVLMLALGDDEGRVDVDDRAALPFGLAAAVLLTLAARERIRHDDDLWTVADETPTGDPALDPALRAMAASGNEPRGTMHWLRALPGVTADGENGTENGNESDEDGLRDHMLHHLTDEGVLEEETHRFLGVYPYRRYPTVDPDPEQRVRAHVRRVVLEGEKPDDRALVLIALMNACGLTHDVFDAKERDEAGDRLDELTEDARVARAVSSVDDETTAAVLTATSAATAAATNPL